jgi:tRNA-modifying protein YgfZ
MMSRPNGETSVLRFDTPLRNAHDDYVRARRDQFAAAAVAAERPDAATGKPIDVPTIEVLPYGPRDENGRLQCEIIGTFGEVQAEYAAIRRGAGLLDAPHRAAMLVTGSDRIEYLNRLLTAELNSLSAGGVREAFWLNRKGRIEADLMLAELGEELLVDVDVLALERTVSSLNSFVFAEDVLIESACERYHRIDVHGRESLHALGHAVGQPALSLENYCATKVEIAGVRVAVARCDQTGEVGLRLFVPREQAEPVWNALLAADEAVSGGKRRVRPIGWHAFNIARIEAGTPLFLIDFGTENLPHETGVLPSRVSFTKGCFLGQEVVARMQHLGKPKRTLVGLRVEGDLLPVEGAAVYEAGEPDSAGSSKASDEPIGMVTSSTLSPLAGAQPIAFAMLRTKAIGTSGQALVEAEGHVVRASVSELTSLAETS